MRGKVSRVSQPMENFRITPAYAGKRLKLAKTCTIIKDHPCVCGEKVLVPEFFV